ARLERHAFCSRSRAEGVRVVPDSPDMSHPVTRAELREELSKYATKLDLDAWGNRLLEMMRTEIRSEIRSEMRVARQELGEELARHVRAANEEMRDWMRAFHDPYKDLPPRVDRLEAKVFAPKRRRR